MHLPHIAIEKPEAIPIIFESGSNSRALSSNHIITVKI